MTDRELLELAAKAAGLNIKGYRVDIDDNFTHVVVGRKGTREKTNWNPLTDDGDALRLAVKLGLGLVHGWESFEGLASATMWISHDGQCLAEEVKFDDPYVATRRAIVRAAAEIGRSMK